MKHSLVVAATVATVTFVLSILSVPFVAYLFLLRQGDNFANRRVNIGIPGWILEVSLPVALLAGAVTLVIESLRRAK